MFDHLDDPQPYVPREGLRPSVERRARSLTRRRRAVVGTAVASLVVIAGVAGAVGTATVVDHKLQHIDTVDVPNLRQTAEPGDPKVVLFVGADSDSGMPTADPSRSTGSRADTILLARVDPGKERISVLSIPRDLLVDIPGRGIDRINAAYAYGGPDLLVQTIDQNLGIEVDRYVQADFRGAAAVGDAIGGLKLDFPRPVRDGNTGLDLPAGCSTLSGTQLLAVGRSRHVRFFEEGQWKRDPTSDLGRMLRQQAIATALLRQLTDVDRTSPAEVNRLLDAVVREVTVDQHTTPRELLALFRGIEGSTPETLGYPVYDTVHDGAAVLQLGPGAAEVTGRFLDTDTPQPPSAPNDDVSAAPPVGTSVPLTEDEAIDHPQAPATFAPPYPTPSQAIPTPC